jgi:hypothetical protein
VGNIGLGVIIIGVFIMTLAFTWSLRHAFNTTVWFSVGWVGTLFVLYVMDVAGYGYISTSPLGPGGAVALGGGAIVAYIYHRRWMKQQAIKKAREAAERAARRARGEPEPTLLGNVFRTINKVRSSNRQ